MTARPRPPAAAALALLCTLGALAPGPAAARSRSRHAVGRPARLLLDGQPTQVRWVDGDTFKVDSGALRGFSARLAGYNALESYGPVHRIGAASPVALWALARSTAALLARTEWRCRTLGQRDGYGRALVACPDAALALVRAGHAMVFAVDAPADPELLSAQRQAQAAGVGLWAGGVPREIVTSVHAAGERGLGPKGPYDRVVDTRTGAATARPHQRAYATCEEVCTGEAPLRSCMVYVPFERHYRDRPACLGLVPEEEAPPSGPGSGPNRAR